MPVDVKALRELAEKATRGPWETKVSMIFPVDGAERDEDGNRVAVANCGDEYKPVAGLKYGDERDANARFIAAANPSAVLALLDEIERKDRALQPFADIGAWLFARDLPDDTPMVEIGGLNGGRGALTRGDFKEAHRALSPATPMEEMSNDRK